MAPDKILEDLSDYQVSLSFRVFDLVIGRVLKRVYSDLDEAGKKDVEEAFLSDDDDRKDKIVKKYIPGFKELFEQEAYKIEEEIKSEIGKQV